MTVELYTRTPTYTVKTFDLNIPRTNEKVLFKGQLIIVKEITGNATIRFNHITNDEIPLTEMRGKTSVLYNKFYITNVAQAGKTLKLLVGRDMDFESGNDVSIVDLNEKRINPATSENQISLTKQITLMPVSTHTTSWASAVIPISQYDKGNVIAYITTFKNTVGNERLMLFMETSIDGIKWKHVATFIDEEMEGNVISVTGDPDRHKIKRIGDFLIQFNDCIMKFIRINGILEGTSPNITIEVIGAFK